MDFMKPVVVGRLALDGVVKRFSDRALAWLNAWFCDFINRQVNLYGSVVETRFRAYEGPGADAPKGFLLGFE